MSEVRGKRDGVAMQKIGLSCVCLFVFMSALGVGCADKLDDEIGQGTYEKAREDWPDVDSFPSAQDLAILLPRSPVLRIGTDTQDANGLSFLPQEWAQQIDDVFRSTVVEGAFLEESPFETWHVAAIRIVPCGVLGKVPSPENDVLCWPGVRVV